MSAELQCKVTVSFCEGNDVGPLYFAMANKLNIYFGRW